MDLSVGEKQEVKEYRKGNWSVEETMVLIQAKKMDEERRMKRPIGGKPPELRWKWVEDYCRRRGCLRSQSQCNDKWDNLMRDFRRVREYEGRAAEEGGSGGGGGKSYWRIEKNERRERNLPSNMLPEIYEALMMDVKDKKNQRFGGVSLLQEPPVTPAAGQPAFAFSQPLPTIPTEATRSRRRRRGERVEGTSGEASGTSSRLEEVISKSASTIAEAIHSCKEGEERREREMMRVHERMLQIEEMNRRGIITLVDAINKLSDSVFALAHHTPHHHPNT